MMALAIAAGVLGAAIGSFLNVVVYRLPRGDSLSSPPSRCPVCGQDVRWRDNVPVVSWLVLRGRCRDCEARISARYPLVELATALLFAAVVVAAGADSYVWLGFALVTLVVPVTLIDLDHRIVPNRILLPAAVAGVALVAVADLDRLPEHLAAGAGAFAFLLVAALIHPKGMGMGDVKLAGVLGIYLGLEVVPALLVAFLTGAAVGVALLARDGAGARKQGVPFAPFLAFGALVGWFVGPELIDLYRDNFL
jgi:leader peptidase (prepilin peptidase)/N-methyltransferase